MKRVCIFFIAVMVIMASVGIVSAQENDYKYEGDSKAKSELKKYYGERGKVSDINKAYARNYLKIARGQYESLRLEVAKENLKLALRYDPEMKEAVKLLEQVQGLLGERPDRVRTFFESALKEQKIKVQQRKIEMENLIAKGRELLDKGEFREALDKFEASLQIHRWMPYQMEFPEIKREAQKLYDETKKKAAREAIEDRKRRQEKAQKEAIVRLVKERDFEQARIEGLFDRLKNAYYNKSDFELARKLADEILSIDVNNKLAWEWKHDAIAKKHAQNEAKMRLKDAEEMKNLEEHIHASLIPQTRLIEYPDNWLETVKNRTAPTVGFEEKPEWKRNIMAQMERKVTFDFLETPLEQVVQFLQRVTGITIVLDPAALVDDMGTPVPRNVTLRVDNMRFSSALNWILRLTDLRMSLRDEAIYMGKEVDTEAILRIYDVRDLTIQPADMPGPDIQLVSGEPDISIGSIGGDMGGVEVADLIDLIKSSVAPEIWLSDDSRVGIEEQAGKLVATAPERVHELIQQLLDNFRQQNVLQVNVVARFLSVHNDFVDDIGVQINNWNTSTGEIPGVGNIFTPHGIGTINGAAGSNSFTEFEIRDNDSLGPWDLGFVGPDSTYYARMTQDSGVGEILTGLWFNYSVDGSIQADFILHAMEASRKGRLLSAPRLTVFNNQRAHIMVVIQHAYIRDVTPVVAERSSSFDPEIDTFTTGTVLDVRPTVSSDRRYITLEVRPTQAKLYTQDIKTYEVTGTGATAIIEMPEIEIHRVRTNAVIPDRGTIILGGLSSVWQDHLRQGIPFLSHIPFIGRLFGRDVTADQRETLLMLITCSITMFKELEEDL